MDKELEQQIVGRVMERLAMEAGKLNLNKVKRLMEDLEQEAQNRGLRPVIAVCGADGNMIAVHRMEGAYLASFDVAMKKAYTAAAVQMSTQKLGELAQPGGMFYGVDKADHGRLIVFGGGVPLYYKDQLIGALGISGGTSEEDHALAEWGQKRMGEIFYG